MGYGILQHHSSHYYTGNVRNEVGDLIGMGGEQCIILWGIQQRKGQQHEEGCLGSKQEMQHATLEVRRSISRRHHDKHVRLETLTKIMQGFACSNVMVRKVRQGVYIVET